MTLYFAGIYVGIAVPMSLFAPIKTGRTIDTLEKAGPGAHVVAGLLWPLILVVALVVWARQRL